MSLRAEAEALYGKLPDEFTASRNARAKELRAEGDRALAARVGKLPKPRMSAWVLNMLVRQRAGEIEYLVGLGSRIRDAQSGSSDDLRALHDERRQMTSVLTQQAKEVAADYNYVVGDEMAAEVENTLRAAMADPAGGAALRTGLLVATFTSSGFDSVDVNKIVAVPECVDEPATQSDPAPQPDPPKQPNQAPQPRPKLTVVRTPTAERDNEAERAAEAARLREAVADADRSLQQAVQSLADATRSRESLESERATLQERLRTLEKEIFTAVRAEDAASREQERATKAHTKARRAAERATKRPTDH